jgi:hypothetical protein
MVNNKPFVPEQLIKLHKSKFTPTFVVVYVTEIALKIKLN